MPFRTSEKKADDAGHRHETAGSFATGFDSLCPLRTITQLLSFTHNTRYSSNSSGRSPTIEQRARQQTDGQ